MTIPTNEPTELRAGDTWEWRREDLSGDYPASAGWTLKYRFKNATIGFEIVATADGDFFAVSYPGASSAALAADKFSWQARVESGTTFHTVDEGTLEVLANLFSGTAAAASDQRTHAATVLDAIEAVIEGRASKDQEEYTIGNRSLKRTPLADLLKLRTQYRAEVYAEENPGGAGGRLVVRL